MLEVLVKTKSLSFRWWPGCGRVITRGERDQRSTQGVVTLIRPVEPFATGIKITSSDQGDQKQYIKRSRYQ